MKIKLSYFILPFLLATVFSCGADKQKTTTPLIKQKINPVDSLSHDTTILKESFNEDDFIENEYLTDRLKPIRANFKRINSITKWEASIKKDLEETTEGGEATYYYLNKELEKIVTRYYGETFQLLTEYYFLNGQLSFVFERSYKYNRPMYYDTIAMKQNNDTAAFDLDKSEIVESRNYFENKKLIHQITNQDCGSPFTGEYLQAEQKRIRSEYDKLIKLMSKN